MAGMQYRTIPIVSARFFEPRPDATEPTISGCPQRMAPLLQGLEALAQAEFGRPVPRTVWLRELKLEEHEVLVRLAPMPGVCGPEFAQAAFDLLRRQLHDTDIYVQPAPH